MSDLAIYQPTIWAVIQNGKVVGVHEEACHLNGIAAIPYRPQIEPDTSPVDLGDIEFPEHTPVTEQHRKLLNDFAHACAFGDNVEARRAAGKAVMDVLQRVDKYAYEINKLRNVIQSACIGGTDAMLKRWVQLFPDAPVPTVTASAEGLIDITDMLKLESMKPVEGMDEILKHYETTFGRTPDAFMRTVVTETKERLMIWWGTHREIIRKALIAAQEAS